MPRLDNTPLIYVDVDGPLIPFRARTSFAPRLAPAAGDNPLLDRLDPEDGRRLLALRGQLVWATTWMAEANEVISPRLGLPVLPVVECPDDDDDENGRLHWKTVFLSAYAATRPFVWLDDEITDVDRSWVRAHHPSPALLHRVDPFAGLTEADYSAVRLWLDAPGPARRSWTGPAAYGPRT